jgi:succinate dehydrogenase / fumarate reductase iron-sulfur subunit
VAPMSQIMRLRRRAGDDHGIVDRNNGHRHEQAFTSLVRDNGLLWEAELLPRSYGGDSFFGKFAPPAALELVDSLPAITKALVRRKVTPMGALKPHKIPKEDRRQLKRLYDTIEGRDERVELNLYISGYDEDEQGAEEPQRVATTGEEGMTSAPGGSPAGDGSGA